MRFLWRLIPAVRPRERTRFAFFFTLDLLMSLSQTLGLVAIESLILTHWGAQALPLNFVVASLITVVGSLLYALGVDRAKNDRYYIWLNVFFAALVFTLAAAAPGHPVAYLALGCVYYLSFAVLNNHYWTFIGDFFDTLSTKRLFPIFIIGNSLGGFLGGALVSSGWLSTEALLPGWALLMLATALLIRLSRRSLRRWGPLELEESDESSLDGLRQALLYLRSSKLGRRMVASFFALVTALFISQYLYSQVFSQEFPDSEKLTHFFGVLLTFTNLMEIAIEGWLTPLLVRTLGVASSNLLHPITTMLGFILLSLRFSLVPAILCRINRETLDNALGQPVRSMVYNALPDRFRGRLRAFLEGIVVYTGMAVAGLFLMLSVGRVSSRVLTGCGIASGLVYLWANFRVRSVYLSTLLTELRAGRVELGDLGDQLARFEVNRLGELWEALIAEAGERPNPIAVRFAETLAARGVTRPLVQTALSGSRTWLRSACLRALGKEVWRFPQALEQAAYSGSSDLRLAALEALALQPLLAPTWIEKLCEDSDPEVRALALSLGLDETGLLEAQASETQVARALPALGLLTQSGLPCLVKRSQDLDGRIRAACLRRIGELAGETNRSLLQGALGDLDVQVVVAALEALAGDEACWPQSELKPVVMLLGSPLAEVRMAASRLLGLQGEQVLPLLLPGLSSENGKTVVAALDVLSLMHNRRAREEMANQLRQRTQQIWYLNLANLIVAEQTEAIETPAGEARAFLAQTLGDAARRDLKLAFEILSHIEDPKIMRTVEKVLRFANSRARADALEVLSNLGDRESSSLLVLLLEDGPWEDRIMGLPPIIRRPTGLEDVLAWCRASQDRWLQMAARSVQVEHGRDHSLTQKHGLMERLLVLRKVPLFGQMSLDQLEAINQLLKPLQYLKGETIIRQADLGDELYILVEGSVRVVQDLGTLDEFELNRISGVSYFGEMSILDDEPRSASVLATEDSRLLVLKGDQLKELVMQMPEMAFEIFKVLTARVRTTSAKVAEHLRTGEFRSKPAG